METGNRGQGERRHDAFADAESAITPDQVPGLVDQLAGGDLSPYRYFTASRWAEFRADTPLTLKPEELKRLRSLNDPIDMDEVRRIYLSLSRL